MANTSIRTVTTVLFTVLLAAVLTSGSSQNSAYVIRNARVHTMASAGTLASASVVILDGRIADVGASVRAPAGAQVINGQGLEVYPGMVNAWGNIGLT